MILVDTNVLIATVVDWHDHHSPSAAFLRNAEPAKTLIAAHSLAEGYSGLTRANGAFRLTPRQAGDMMRSLAGRLTVVALNAPQTIDAISRFAALGGVGPRLYDYLIGATGETFGADTIVTWNLRHFEAVFPSLRVTLPEG